MPYWIVYDEPSWPSGVRYAGYGTLEEAELQAAVDLAAGAAVREVVQADLDPDWIRDAETHTDKEPVLAELATVLTEEQIAVRSQDADVADALEGTPRALRGLRK